MVSMCVLYDCMCVCLYLWTTTMATRQASSPFPICDVLIRQIDCISKLPVVVLLSLGGLVTMLPCSNHRSAPVGGGGQSRILSVYKEFQPVLSGARNTCSCSCCDIITWVIRQHIHPCLSLTLTHTLPYLCLCLCLMYYFLQCSHSSGAALLTVVSGSMAHIFR
jgi:hypothetical protein